MSVVLILVTGRFHPFGQYRKNPNNFIWPIYYGIPVTLRETPTFDCRAVARISGKRSVFIRYFLYGPAISVSRGDNNNNNNNNKPDIIIRDNEKGKCMLIDVAISGNRNVIKKKAEKILKYKDLTIERERMWKVKTKVIPVIIRTTGTVSKSFRKYVSNIPGKYEVKEVRENSHIVKVQ